MKYTLEVNGNKATETFVVNGKEYKRTWSCMMDEANW